MPHVIVNNNQGPVEDLLGVGELVDCEGATRDKSEVIVTKSEGKTRGRQGDNARLYILLPSTTLSYTYASLRLRIPVKRFPDRTKYATDAYKQLL